jgi:hypothetical protein
LTDNGFADAYRQSFFLPGTATPEHKNHIPAGLNRGKIRPIRRPWLVGQIDDTAAGPAGLLSRREIAWLTGDDAHLLPAS